MSKVIDAFLFSGFPNSYQRHSFPNSYQLISNEIKIHTKNVEFGFFCIILWCCCSVAKSCLTLCDLVDCHPPGLDFVHGISQARMLEWVAIFFSKGSFWPRNWTFISCIGMRIFHHWATGEAPCIALSCLLKTIISSFSWYRIFNDFWSMSHSFELHHLSFIMSQIALALFP